ncbi:IS1595 family transposase [[Clostridium] innocuum]|uniref:IS1595 family transposase n=1 Tax=Clostridium innocuum TaxID=1522 RepID=UPI003257C6D3
MEEANKEKMDVRQCMEELKERYSFDDVKELFNALNNDILKRELYKHMVEDLHDGIPTCPKCGGQHVHKNGKTEKGLQRYKCSCNKTFILRHNTLMFYSRLSCEQWKMMISSTLNNDSLKTMAALTGISVTSAFYCRHKILYVLVQIMNEDILSDEAELDETYLTYEQEGYIRTGKKGISEDKIAIACAVDIHDNIVLAVADRGRPKSKTLIEIFDKTMTHGMKIVSDSQRSYHPLMNHLDADWKKTPSRKKEIEGYTLDRINNLHEKIKALFRGKRNVKTHYQQGYLALFQYRRKNPMYMSDKVVRSIFSRLNCIETALRNKDICSGVNVYRTFYDF